MSKKLFTDGQVSAIKHLLAEKSRRLNFVTVRRSGFCKTFRIYIGYPCEVPDEGEFGVEDATYYVATCCGFRLTEYGLRLNGDTEDVISKLNGQLRRFADGSIDLKEPLREFVARRL